MKKTGKTKNIIIPEECKEFLLKYNISTEDFEQANLDWGKLQEIKNDYLSYKINLKSTANFILDKLRELKLIHSLKVRIKNEDHLLEKIIRKKKEKKKSSFKLTNYKDKITDLIGLRALHLFKNDWELIHNYITNAFELKEVPIAYIRDGDEEELINSYKEKKLRIKIHPFGYRSIHYVITSKPDRNEYIAEIQVRTLFEEGWSEVDHKLRYPYNKSKPIISEFLAIFNRLAGSADEMATFTNLLNEHIDESNLKIINAEMESKKNLAKLKETISKLDITKKEKDDLKKQIGDYKKISDVPLLTISNIGNALGSAVVNIGELSSNLGNILVSSTKPLNTNLIIDQYGINDAYKRKCAKCGSEFIRIDYDNFCSKCKDEQKK